MHRRNKDETTQKTLNVQSSTCVGVEHDGKAIKTHTGQVAREINVTFLNGLSLSFLGPNINH